MEGGGRRAGLRRRRRRPGRGGARQAADDEDPQDRDLRNHEGVQEPASGLDAEDVDEREKASAVNAIGVGLVPARPVRRRRYCANVMATAAIPPP